MKKFLILCIASTLETATLFAGTVTNTNDSGPGSLRQAILNSAPGETITFAVTGTINLTSGQLLINKDLTISGPGASLLTVRKATIIIGAPFRIFHITTSGLSNTVNISGLHINNGRVTDQKPEEFWDGIGGGAIRVERSNCTVNIINCTINGNAASGLDEGAFGGAIRNFGILTMRNCTVSGNTASVEGAGAPVGGGIWNNGSLTLIECSIKNNSAQGADESDSGTGRAYGGGIVNFKDMTVTHCTISGNSVVGGSSSTSGFPGGDAFGGGIYESGNLATLTLKNSTISGNSATGGQGGGGSGGGSGAGLGGGIMNSDDAVLTLSQSTITANSTMGPDGGEGGGIYDVSGTTIIRSSIIAGNSATTSGPDCRGIIHSEDYNLIQNTSGCTFTGVTTHNITAVAPNLGGLQNNGGRTFTHALLSNSPAIDKGICVDATDDQRRASRPVDFAAIINANDGCDMGSFELGGAPPGPVHLNGAASRKTHGSVNFDINLPLTGNPGVECRSGGANGNHTMVFTFEDPLRSVQGAGVTSGIGAVSSSEIGSNDHEYIVNLTGVANAQSIKVVLSDVNDSAGNYSTDMQGVMGMLLGDTSGNGSVNSSDVSQAKSKSGQTVSASNFRADVTVNATINSSDVSLVKSKSGSALL